MIRIRPYEDTDEAAVLSWCQDEETFYNWTFGVLGEYPITKEKFRTMKDYRRFTAVELPAGSSAEDSAGSPATAVDGQPVGYFIMRTPAGRPSELRFGFGIVATDQRGRGVGKAMLSQGLKLAFTAYGAERVTLGVAEYNELGRACYSAIGFTFTGKTESYSLCGKELRAFEMEAFPE